MKPPIENIQRHAQHYYQQNLPQTPDLGDPDWSDDSFWGGLIEGFANVLSWLS